MAEEWWSLPPLKVGWEWLKNWVETNIWNPVTDVFRLFKEKAEEAGAWLLNGVQTIRAALAEIHSRILHGVHVAIATAGGALEAAIARVREWTQSAIAAVQGALNYAITKVWEWTQSAIAAVSQALSTAIAAVREWASGLLAAVWEKLTGVLQFLSQIDDWFLSMAKKFIEASGELIYNVLIRFIDLIW